MTPYLFLGLAYLMGAVPTSLWVGKSAFGVDLREEGSGNLGATNTFRVLGAKAAIPVLLFDVFKGFLPAFAFASWAGVEGTFGWTLGFGAAAIVGHVFSVFAGFRGGKGVATSAGVFAALAPAAVGIGLVAFFGAVWLTGYVSLGSILAAVLLPVGIAFTPHQGGNGLLYFSGALSTFVIWAHRANIGRLVRGEENRFRRSGRRSSASSSDTSAAGERSQGGGPDTPGTEPGHGSPSDGGSPR